MANKTLTRAKKTGKSKAPHRAAAVKPAKSQAPRRGAHIERPVSEEIKRGGRASGHRGREPSKEQKKAATMYHFPKLSTDHARRLWKVQMATLNAYGLLPADWIFWAAQAVEQCHEKGFGSTDSWLAQLEGKRGVHLFAQMAYGMAHRNEVDGLVLMLDAMIRLKGKKRTDPRDDARFQQYVAPYFKVVDCTASSSALKKRIQSTWSGKTPPDTIRDDREVGLQSATGGGGT